MKMISGGGVGLQSRRRLWLPESAFFDDRLGCEDFPVLLFFKALQPGKFS
jgi:hypothetical protein